jgi:hypothetical protein
VLGLVKFTLKPKFFLIFSVTSNLDAHTLSIKYK